MSAQHTPGPWFAFPYSEPANNSSGRQLGWHINGAGAGYVMTLHKASHRAAEDEANARLIAAAPDMLEALRSALEVIAMERQSFADCNNVPELTAGDDPDNYIQIGGALFERHDADVVGDYDRVLAQIDAAIGKATGAPL